MVTVNVNVVAPVAQNASVTVTVTEPVPLAFAAGFILIVQSCVAHPQIVIFPPGSKVVLVLTTVTSEAQVTVLSGSSIVNTTPFFAVSSAVV